MDAKSTQCPKCGAAISSEAPEGLCPLCLLSEVSKPTEPVDAVKPQPPSLAELAAAFPQFEIIEMIGRGGMGYVFKARQPKLDRFVALKILPATLAADPAFADRFTQEGRVLARLNHPNIVTIHDFGQASGFFYLVMEFVDGVNLRQAMKIGRFTPEQALTIVPKICDALEFAHHEGILHRDIKPENVLLDSRGRVKIADFGIAKILGTDRETTLTPTSAEHQVTGVIGTPQYMAPEQIENPRKVDQRADVYALGVVFYEMLTGELPLGRFAPPSTKSAADPRLDEVVLRALEKEPARRTGSAGEVKTQVETIATTPPPVSPESRSQRNDVPPWTVHVRRALRAGIAIFVLCFLAAIAIAFILPETYMATARVEGGTNDRLTYDPYFIQTEFEKIKSQKTLLQVSDSLQLPQRWGKKYGVGTMKSSEILDLLRNSIDLKQSRNTSLMEISAFSDSATETAEIANALANAYLALPANKAALVDPAAVPIRPARPKRPLIIFIGSLLGLAAGSLSSLVTGSISWWRYITAPNRPPTAARAKRPALPLSVFIIASVLVVFGAVGIAQTVHSFASRSHTIDLGLFAFPVGLGLFRQRKGWRMAALVTLGLYLTFLIILVPAKLAGWLDFPIVKITPMRVISSNDYILSGIFVGCLAAFLAWAFYLLFRQKSAFTNVGSRGPWVEWLAMSGAIICVLLFRLSVGQPDRGRVQSELASEPSRLAPQERTSGSTNTETALARRPAAARLKSIELSRISRGVGNRISIWTDTKFAPGETTVATETRADGSVDEANTQVITIRGSAGARVSTVFGWALPASFGAEAQDSAQTLLQTNLFKPIALEPNTPFPLFTLTNQAGGRFTASLLFRPSDPSMLPSDAQATIHFSRVTNVSPMLLGYFSATVPTGCVLQAFCKTRDGQQTDAHTSISRAPGYDNESVRWDFPSDFTEEQMRAAATQAQRHRSITVTVGQTSRVFAVTNDAGRVHEGFFELLGGSPNRTQNIGEPSLWTARGATIQEILQEIRKTENLLRLGPYTTANDSDPSRQTLLSNKVAYLRQVVDEQRRLAPSEIARLKLQFSEEQLIEAQKKYEVGAIDPLTMEKAKAARDMLKAEMDGDAVEKARINLRIAERELDVATKKRANGVESNVAEAKLARDIAAVQLGEAEAANAK